MQNTKNSSLRASWKIVGQKLELTWEAVGPMATVSPFEARKTRNEMQSNEDVPKLRYVKTKIG